MHKFILTQMVEQYLNNGQIDPMLWTQLDHVIDQKPIEDMCVTLELTPTVKMDVTPWSVAMASKSLKPECLEVLTKLPNAYSHMHNASGQYASRSFFEELVELANTGTTTDKYMALSALQFLHTKNMLPSDARVLKSAPDSIPKNLLNWALQADVGVVAYYEQHKNTQHNSPVWAAIESHTQHKILTHHTSSLGKSSPRTAKI